MTKKIFSLVLLISLSILVKAQTNDCNGFIYNNVISTDITSSLSNDFYYLQNSVEIIGDVTFDNIEMLIAPGATITINYGSKLTILGSHLFSCTEMWEGIRVVGGGKIVTGASSSNTATIIEDADIAILVECCYDCVDLLGEDVLNVTNCIFNRNRIGINFNYARFDNWSNEPLPHYPVKISNSIFTCRKIDFNVGTLSWVDYESFKNTALTISTSYPNTPLSMAAPYIDDANFSPFASEAFLKSPQPPNKKSEKGINMISFYHFNGIYKFGEENAGLGTNNVVIFDNQTIGIDALHTDFRIVNCTFQNTLNANSLSTVGIRAAQFDELKNRFYTNVPSGTPHNAFFDCGTAIDVKFYADINIQHNDIRSSKITDLKNTIMGREGIMVTTTFFGWEQGYNNSIIIEHNEIANIAYGINISYDDYPWWYNQPWGPSGNTYLANHIEVNHNWISKTPAPWLSVPLLPEYFVEQAINFDVVTPTILQSNPLPPLHCNTNLIGHVNNGIRFSNWDGKDLRVVNNTVLLTWENTSQNFYGIRFDGCIPQNSNANLVYNNWVLREVGGFSNLKQGFYFNNGGGFTIKCNKAQWGIENHYQFNGSIFNTNFTNNQSIAPSGPINGLTFLPLSEIGVQGTPLKASDNRFVDYTNPTTQKKSFCLNTNANWSRLHVQLTNLTYDPSFGGYSFANGAIGVPHDFSNGSLVNGSNSGFYCQPIVEEEPGGGEDPGGEGRFANRGSNNTIDFSKIKLNTKLDTAGIVPKQIPNEQQRIKEAEQIILANNIPSSTPNKNLYDYVAQMQLYSFSAKQPAFVAKSSIVSNFMQRHAISSFSIIPTIAKKWYSGDTANFKSLMSSWQRTNVVDENYYNFYTWLQKRKAKQTLDTAAILQLAQQCPQTHGNIVFAAQNLYNAITNQHIIFEAACETEPFNTINKTTNYAKRTVSTNPEIANPIGVYPNPTACNVYVTGSNIKSIIVFNSLGKQISQLVPNSKNVTQINLANYTKGLYLLQVVKYDGTIETRKVVKQ